MGADKFQIFCAHTYFMRIILELIFYIHKLLLSIVIHTYFIGFVTVALSQALNARQSIIDSA